MSMYPEGFLRLLAVRASMSSDPAPGLPDSAAPFQVAGAADAPVATWRAHWSSLITRIGMLSHDHRDVPIWPVSLPVVDGEALNRWRSSLRRTPAGTPLEERPSRLYWHARTANPDLPRTVVVLPFEESWSRRATEQVGLVSVATFFTDAAEAFLL
ncbi:hypothetical protein DEI81_02380 [Curtobacterium sp. MCBD17_013]|nr:hypothetical protein DEI81_02380 [Curtobacterium sp. MCBD17_013]